jgi:hypothetical protein
VQYSSSVNLLAGALLGSAVSALAVDGLCGSVDERLRDKELGPVPGVVGWPCASSWGKRDSPPTASDSACPARGKDRAATCRCSSKGVKGFTSSAKRFAFDFLFRKGHILPTSFIFRRIGDDVVSVLMLW